jgi:16S rRNA (uracil1498-N3)-methyltransferase
MPAFFIDSRDIQGESVKITGELLHHLRASLRIRPGEALTLTDERQRRYHAVVTDLAHEHLIARITHTIEGPERLYPALTLGQALLKGDHMDWIIQKATELGVRQIVPLVTGHSIVRPRKDRTPAQTVRWQRIAHEAAQQSEQWRIPVIAPPCEVADFFAQTGDAVRLVLVERAEGKKLTEIPMPRERAASVVIAVGPEGGWRADEIALASEQGFEQATLGSMILRSETASLTALAVLQSRLGALA